MPSRCAPRRNDCRFLRRCRFPSARSCVFLSFSDSIRSARCMGRTCTPTVQPAARPPHPALRARHRPSFAPVSGRAARIAARAVQLRGYPASLTRLRRGAPRLRGCGRRANCRAIPVELLWVRRLRPFSLPFRESRSTAFAGRMTSPAPKHTHLRRRVSGFVSAPSFVAVGASPDSMKGLRTVRCPASTCPHCVPLRQTAANRMDIALSSGPHGGPLCT